MTAPAPLFTDPDVLIAFSDDWSAVRRMREQLSTMVRVAFASGAWNTQSLAGVVYNLPVLLAFDVLRRVLRQARDDGRFVCSRSELKELVKASKDLAWIEWAEIRVGVDRRNAIAHKGELFPAKQCIEDIARVDRQLVEWKVIEKGGA